MLLYYLVCVTIATVLYLFKCNAKITLLHLFTKFASTSTVYIYIVVSSIDVAVFFVVSKANASVVMRIWIITNCIDILHMDIATIIVIVDGTLVLLSIVVTVISNWLI